MIIKQNIEGLFTPTYESYDFNVIGLPFAVSRMLVDGKELKDFHVDEKKCFRFKSNKNFKQIQVFK